MPIKSKCGNNFGFLLVNGDDCHLSQDFGAFWKRGEELEFIPRIEMHEFELDEEEMIRQRMQTMEVTVAKTA